jgi:hypothetical protein
MSDTPIKDALDQLGSSGDGLTGSGAFNERTKSLDAGVEFTKSWGSSWSTSAAWTYTKELGNTILGKVTWRPKAKE